MIFVTRTAYLLLNITHNLITIGHYIGLNSLQCNNDFLILHP